MTRNRLPIVLVAVLAAVLLLPSRALAAGKVLYSGTWGTCPWEITDDGTLTVHPGTGDGRYDSYEGYSYSYWYPHESKVTSIVFLEEGGRKVVAPQDSSCLLRGMEHAVAVDLSGLDTSHVTSMRSMFSSCSSLSSLDLSPLDTSCVTDMFDMFYGCSGLKSLDLSPLDTSSVTEMTAMFEGCSGLKSLDLSPLDTSSVTRMVQMFKDCSSLTSLDLSPLDTSSVTQMWGMFLDCTSLGSVDLSGLDASSVTYMDSMFEGCSSLTYVDFSGIDTTSAKDMNDMFYGCSSLTTIDLSSLDTSSVTDMDGMFGGCSSLAYIDLSSLDTSRVTDMGGMFGGCSSLAYIDPSSLDTSRVTDMGSMFYGCSSLTSLDLSGFDVSGVTDMPSMFRGCTGLTSLDLSFWSTPSMTWANMLFMDCSSLESIVVGDGWFMGDDDARDMFKGCVSLVGENGTAYDADHTDGVYARVDAPGSPGYLTSPSGSGGGNTYSLSTATMTLNGQDYNLLNTERTIDVVAKNTKFTLTVELGDGSPKPAMMVLYQKDEDGSTLRIASAGSDGSFGTLSYGQFTDGASVYVNVIDSKGKVVLTRQLLLNVGDSSKADIPQTFSLGDGIEYTYSGWPLDGARVKIPIWDFPITCSISDDGTIRMGINIDINKVLSDEPGFWERLHNDQFWRKAFREAEYNNLLLRTGQKRFVGEPKWEVNVIGYLEGTLGSNVYKGHIAIELCWGGSWETQVYVASVPCVVEVSAKAKGEGAYDTAFHVEGNELIYDSSRLTVGAEGSFGLYAGVGLAEIISGGIWGKVTFGASYLIFPEEARGFEEVYGKGEAGFKAIVLGTSWPVTLFHSGGQDSKHYFYKRDTSTGRSMPELMPYGGVVQTLRAIDTDLSYEGVGRTYLSGATAWDGDSGSESLVLLQGGGYPYAEVRTADVDGGQLLVFLSDDASRGSANRTVLVWSRYDESSGTWSEPLPVWEDGTADFYPSVCPDGLGGAWVVWSNARSEVPDGLPLEDEAALFDISVAHFDAASGAFEGQSFVTDDASTFEVSPSVAASLGTPVAAWVANPAADILGVGGGQRIAMATLAGEEWSTSEVAAAPSYVMSVRAGWLGGPAVAWSTDDDGSMETVEDARVYAWTETGGASVMGASHSWNPVFVESSGDPALVWCQDGVLTASTDGLSSTPTSLEFVPRTSFHLTGDVEGDALVTYSRHEDGAGNVYGRMARSGEWGDEFALTSQGQSVTSWATFGPAAAPMIVYAASTETETSSTDTGVWASGGAGITVVHAECAWYENGSIIVPVTNGGCTSLQGVTVTVSEGGEVVASYDASVSLSPGESGYAVVPFAEPSDGTIHTYEVRVSSATEVLDLTLGNPVLLAELTHGLSEDGENVSVTVTNAGGSATQAGSASWKNSVTGEVLGEAELPALAPGESATISFSADGMLFEDGILSTEVEIIATDANSEQVFAYGYFDSFTEAVDDELDEDATGAGPWDISEAVIEAIAPQGYTGSPVTPIPVVQRLGDELVPGRDFTVSYEDNIELGTATLTITGAGAFTGSAETTFDIIEKAPEKIDISGAEILPIADQPYDGSPVTPAVTVMLDGSSLREGVDYDVTYSNNDAPGTATVTVTGKGDFDGEVSATFEIVDQVEVEGIPMYRLYNRWSYEHFYTGDEAERDRLVSVGWTYEGIGWMAPAAGDPVYRLYNQYAPGGDHHYTMDADEYYYLCSVGWSGEGVGWYSDPDQAVPVYREYNPWEYAHNHNYTADYFEHEMLLGVGWNDEGIGWYGV